MQLPERDSKWGAESGRGSEDGYGELQRVVNDSRGESHVSMGKASSDERIWRGIMFDYEEENVIRKIQSDCRRDTFIRETEGWHFVVLDSSFSVSSMWHGRQGNTNNTTSGFELVTMSCPRTIGPDVTDIMNDDDVIHVQ